MDKNAEFALLKMTTIIKEYDDSFTKHLYNATGFFCKNENEELFLITNYHVIKDSINYKIYITLFHKNENGETIRITNEDISFTIDKNDINSVRINAEYDICAISFTEIYNKLIADSKYPNIAFVPFHGLVIDFSDFNHIEELLMIGYPDAIINEDINLPIVRKGITSTSLCSQLDGEERFIINIPVFPGSSGSPVFYNKVDENKDKLRLVGIVTQYYHATFDVVQEDNDKNVIGKVKIPNGLGRVTKSNILYDLLKV